MNGAAGTIAGMGREAEATIKERAKEWMGGLDFVSRDADIGARGLRAEGPLEDQPEGKDFDAEKSNDWPGPHKQEAKAEHSAERAEHQHHTVEAAR